MHCCEHRQAVAANAKRVKACEAQRLSMEAEESAYYKPPAGTQGGTLQITSTYKVVRSGEALNKVFLVPIVC